MKMVAVTSCATGIAHSYMAAEAIKKIAKRKGCQVKVEIQGALGIENALTSEEIKEADIIVFANDVGIANVGRFANFKNKIIQSGPHEVIRNPEGIFEKAKQIADAAN